MSDATNCPKCQSANIYFEGSIWTCPECWNEWTIFQTNEADSSPTTETDSRIKDAFGNILAEGDAVTIIKDLKIKGSSAVVKIGTKIKNIRLVDSDDGHNIACKIDGIGSIHLKSEFVKKA
ncbi:MAG: alkylphosphonate utilization protein [Oligoflexia bacterium]|nr:alkylphosphonate utilization protein [Oligoflexia bacterium]